MNAETNVANQIALGLTRARAERASKIRALRKEFQGDIILMAIDLSCPDTSTAIAEEDWTFLTDAEATILGYIL